MCKLKSGIILKNRVFVPEYDSHTDMLEELGIEDNYLNASKTFVRVELSPADDDVFSDIDTWILKIDQDIIPEWYNEEKYKPQVAESVKEWAKTHIHTGIDNLKITAGQNHYIKDCQNVVIYGNATVEEIYGNATVEEIYGNATVEEIYGNATVEGIEDFAVLKSHAKYIWHKNKNLTVKGNATFKDCYNKILYQAGDWEMVNVESEGE